MSKRHALLIALLLPAASPARAGIAIDETALRLTLDAERSVLHVPVAHRGAPCTALLQVEVRPPSGAPRAQATATAALRPGSNEVTVELPARLGAGAGVQQSDLLQDRIAYEASGCGTTLRGVRAVAELTGQAFALRASLFGEGPRDGRAVTVTVSARGHDGRPAAGVELTARIEEGGAPPVRGVTGDDGRALIEVPVGRPYGVFKVEVEGRRGALASTVAVPFVVGAALRARIMTSQPIYRPGQPLRARVLLLDARRAVRPDVTVSARLTSPSGEVVWQSPLTFSRHGVAPLAWDVPARAETGDYTLGIEIADGSDGSDGSDVLAIEAIAVERYELPVFRMEARPAQAFFLPGQPAAVEVRVARLTGEPLAGASVRLGDADGAQVLSDAEGRALLPVDLAEQHEYLEDGEPQFVDHDVLVTVTDPVSLRSEARQVTVRATLLPLHVHWWSRRWEERRSAPLEGYVSTQLADGTPVAADVTLSGAVTARVRTGTNGIARVRAAWQAADSDPLLLAAADAAGRAGRARTRTYASEGDTVRLDTPRALLHPGEPARVTVRAYPPGGVLVQLWHDGRLIDTRALAAGAQPTTVELAPPDGIRGLLSVTALRDDGDAFDTVALVCPDGRRLHAALTVQPARARPGDTVEATVALTDAGGRPVAGALGVAGVDVAVLDRARMRHELDRGWQRPGEWLEEPEDDLVSRLAALDPAASWSDEEQLAAEARLAREGTQMLSVEEESGRSTDGFAETLRQAGAALRKALLQADWPEGFPRSPAEVRAAARRAQLDADRLEDPWGNPLRIEWEIAGDRVRVRAHTMGPDERAGTPDDDSRDVESWRWFAGRGDRLAKALRAYLDRTDRIPLTAADLAPDLRAHGLGPEALRDPWGRRLTLEPGHRGSDAVVLVRSRGPTGSTLPWTAWTAEAAMFVRITTDARERVQRWADERRRMPRDDAELRDAGVRVETLRDPWGHGIHARFRSESRYTDVRQADGTPRAVTQQTDVVDLMAAGPDGRAETDDDVLLTTLRRVVGETGSLGEPSPRLRTEPVVSGTTGAIVGWVEDATGAGIPGVTVQASTTARAAEGRTDADGAYAIGGLQAGTYVLRFELTGFVSQRIEGVEVRAGERTSVDVTLRVSSVQEEVMVTAEGPEVDTTSTARAASPARDGERTPVRRGPTPRLRTYFPDALLWRPEVETDEDGRARLSFPLPDSLTTWELAALASTADGLTAPARAQVVGALPFSAELAPPPVMTVGDVVQLPVPIRNDLDEPVEVLFSVERDAAFGGGPAEPESVTVPAGDVGLPAVELRAVLPARDAALTASARAPAHADRIRKTVTIRADGEPSAETRGEEITARRSTLGFRIPDQALPGSAWAELRILPDLRAHVAGAVTGAMARPWGCAEQTISAVFPSLLLLEMAAAGPHDAALATRARGFLEDGLERLQGYESASGLAYWSGRAMDPALTAYGLRFLARAQRLTDVPSARVDALRNALLAAQAPDGSWTPAYSAGEGGTALTTAQVARALAQASPTPRPAAVDAAIARAHEFLRPHLERMPEPYLLASWALAARAVGDAASEEAARARLRALERRERDGAFWDLQTNTPFFGWGTAGRLETTGLALQALAPGDGALRSRAVAFLLRGQDRYGVWWSSQATVNVLEGLVAATDPTPAGAGAPGPVEVWRDGARVARLDWPAPGAAPPLVVPLGDDLRPGAHQVVLRGLPAGAAWAQIVTGHARPWTDPVAGASPALRFSVDHDASTTARGAWITTRVRAERVGHRGYGMLLAEVGLPPGADVDRSSLEDALRARGLDRYELQPDRVVLYLWPQAGGADLSFRWRPRFAMDAQAAPSELYDYYNPEEHVRLRPVRFAVR